MSNSWDWVERHKRQQRRRKWFSLLALIVPFGLILYISPLIPILNVGTTEVSDPATAERAHKTESHVPLEVAEIEPAKPDSIADSIISSESSAPPDHAVELPEPNDPIQENIERERANSRLSLTKLRDKIDSQATRLHKFGGDTMAELQSLIDTATASDSPAIILSLVDRAKQLFEAKLPAIEIAEVRASLHDASATEVIAKLIAFRETNPKHPLLGELDDAIKQVGPEGWMKAAMSEMERSSPDNATYFESWLSIASAWSIFGKEDEKREAMRRAREAVPRLTSPDQIIMATIVLCQHDLFDRQLAEPIINAAISSCGEINQVVANRTYTAFMSSLCSEFDMTSDATRLLEAAIEPDKDIRYRANKLDNKLLPLFECQAKVATYPSASLDSIAQALDRRNYQPKAIISACFAYAAIAAAKQNDEAQFNRMILKAESAVSTETFRSDNTYVYGRRIGEAYLAARQWKNAVTVANNITDPRLTASLLFRVLAESPQDVPKFNLRDAFENYGTQQWAADGVAGYVEHSIRRGEDPIELVQWLHGLSDPGLRAAAYAGVARAAPTLGKVERTQNSSEEFVSDPNITNPRSLIEAACAIATKIEDKEEAACAWHEISRSWRLTERQQSYDRAVAMFHDCCFDMWEDIWKQRQSPSRSYDGSYYDDSNYRRKKSETETVISIIGCERRFAEMQSDFGDAKGALDTCIKLANHSGFAEAPLLFVDWQYLFLRAMAIRIESETKVGQDVFIPRKFVNAPYSDAMIAAWSKNIPQLNAAIDKLEKKANQGELARASAELALLYAKRNDIDGYRSARRAAFSQISRGETASAVKSVLATADAIAGEFQLAADNIVSGDTPWFDGASVARSELAIGLAKAGETDRALDEAKKISSSPSYYRTRAFSEIAQARFRKGELQGDVLIGWVESLESLTDRVGVLCGLGIAAENGR